MKKKIFLFCIGMGLLIEGCSYNCKVLSGYNYTQKESSVKSSEFSERPTIPCRRVSDGGISIVTW